jgi:hypothetical protein
MTTDGLPLDNAAPSPLVTFEALGRFGRFGNQLFQVAASIGIARRSGCPVYFPAWSYEEVFAGRLPKPQEQLPARRLLRETTFHYSTINVQEPTQLVGYFQSEKYFAHCADEIRALFTPNREAFLALKQYLVTRLRNVTCSVHVRRGDYLVHPGYAKLFATDYYWRAFELFPADTTFVIFSDDVGWCRQQFKGPRYVFLDGLSDVGQFFAMSACTHHIIANSTFSWWAAWLDPKPQKRVVAPRLWYAGPYADPQIPFVAGPPHSGFHPTYDLIPSGWTVL